MLENHLYVTIQNDELLDAASLIVYPCFIVHLSRKLVCPSRIIIVKYPLYYIFIQKLDYYYRQKWPAGLIGIVLNSQ